MPTTQANMGRKPDASSKSGQVRELLKTGMSAVDIAKKVGCTPALVYTVKARQERGTKRGPGRPRKVGAPSLDGLSGILDAVKKTERERVQMRAALEKLQTVIADALA